MRVDFYIYSLHEVSVWEYIWKALQRRGVEACFILEPPGVHTAYGSRSDKANGYLDDKRSGSLVPLMIPENHARIAAYLNQCGYPFELRGEPLADVVLTTQGVGWLRRYKKLKVRTMYGVGAVRNSFGHGEINKGLDAVLVHGEFSRECIEKWLPRDKIRVAGFPKYSPYFRGEVDAGLWAERFGLDPEKKTIAYLSTWAQNSSLDRYSEALVSLAGRYNVLLKPHHNTLLFEEDRIDALRERGVRIVEDIPTIVPFYAVADLVLADVRSGSFTEAFLMDRRVIGLSPHGDPEQDALIEQAYKAAPICSDPAALEDLIGQSIEMDVYREGRRALAGYLFTTFDGMDDEVAAEEIISLVPRAKVSEAKPGAEARKSGNGQSFSQVLPAAQPGAASARPLSIIIPTYNRADILKMCLDALAIQTYPPEKFEVLVCDDGSTDDTAQMVQSLRMPYRLTYLRQENRGPAAARNMGIRQAEGEYLLILNDDAILEPDVVERHMDHQQLFAGEKVAVLGKFALRPSFTSTPLGYLLEHSDILFWYNRMEPGKFYDYHHFYTCNISLPRQAVLDVGLFDEDFTGPAAEDLELGYRLHQQGYRVYYDTGAVAWHEHELTPAGLCRTQKARGMGAVTLMVKHPEAPFYKNHDFGATEQWRAENQASAPKAAEILQAVEEFNRGFRTNGDPRALEKAAENLYPLVKYLHRYYEREGLLASDWLDRLIELRTGKQPLVEQPKVSVVIPCYNYGRFLAEAVESVLSQSYQNFEILIVNDGSTDNSHEVAEAIIAAHPEARIMLIDQPNSGQPAISRNNGILKADGDYILPLDADDRLAPGALEAFVRAAQSAASPEVVVFGSVQRFGVEDHLWGTRLFEPRELLVRDMLGYCSLYSRSVWEKQGGYKTNVPGYEDWDFWIGALQVGAKFVHVPQVTLHYRRTGEGSLIDRARLKHEWLYAGIIHNHRELFHPAAVAWAQDYLKDHPQPPAERSPHGPEGRYPDIRARLIGAYPEYYSAEERKWARAYLASNPLAATLHRPQTGASPEAEKQPVEQYEEEADALDLSMRFFQKAQEEFRAERPNQAQVWMQRYRRGVNYNLFPRRDYRKEGAPRISVVIVAYETRKLLLECLDGLMKQSDPDFELILVDNGGNEEVHDRLPAYSPLHIQCPHNLVPSEGRNIGVYFSRGEIIAFLDDDARVPPDYIESIRKAFDRYHLLGLRGKVLPKSASGRQVNAGHYDLGDQPVPSSIDTEGNSAFLKRIYLELGGMDPLLFGMEGLELSFRIAQKYGQFSLFYWPETVIFHDYAGTDQKLQAKTARHERMKRYLIAKYPKIYAYHQRLVDLARSPEGRIFGSSLLIERDRGPRFSICIPTYNRARYIRDAIESALHQNYPAAEILIVDDGSDDETAEVVAPYLSDTVRFIQKEHSGAPETRNRLVQEARGEFLVWLDSDDVLLADTLRLYASAILAVPEVDVLYGNLILTNSTLETKSSSSWADWDGKQTELIAELLRHSAIPNPGTCVRKECYSRVGGYDPEFVRAHDYEFWTRLAGAANFKHINNFVCKWRWHDSNISSGTVKRDTRYEAEIVKKMLKRYSLQQLFPAIDWDRMPRKQAEATAYYQVAQILLNYGAVTDARAFLKKSYRCARSTEVEGLLKALYGKKDSTICYPQGFQAPVEPEPAAAAQIPTAEAAGSAEKKRILFIVHGFPPQNQAGTELYTFQMARKLQARGYDIRVLYPEFDLTRPAGALTYDRYEGLPVARLNLRPVQEIHELFKRPEVGKYVDAYLRENPVDLVHVHHLQWMGAEVLRVVKEAGLPLVMTLHDAWFLCDQIHLIHADGSYCEGGPETAEKCVRCFARRNPKAPVESHFATVKAAFAQRQQYLKEALGWVDVVLTPSAFIRDLFEHHGFTHPGMRLAPLGLQTFRPASRRPSNGKLRLVYLGNILYTKGLDVAVEAFNQLSSGDARLDIYGQVYDQKYFEWVMGMVRPGAKVRYRGAYNSADLPQILAQADVAVVPSRIESYSLVIRECLQAGVPVIGPNVGAVPEAIRDGENGLLFRADDPADLAEKMRFFAVQPRRVEAFRERIRPVWTLDEDAKALEGVYVQMLEEKKQPGPSPDMDRHAIAAVLPGVPSQDAVLSAGRSNGRESRAGQTLELLLEADDLLAALQEHAALLDADLLDLVRQNARAARADGDEELAAGLDDLAAYIEGVLAGGDSPADAGAAETPDACSRAWETLALLLEADDLPAALETYANRLDADLLDLVRLNARTARQDGSLELAEGLEALAEYVQEVVQLQA